MTLISISAMAKNATNNARKEQDRVCEIAECKNAATSTVPYCRSVLHVCDECASNTEDPNKGPDTCPNCGTRNHPPCVNCGRKTICPLDEPGENFITCEVCNAADVEQEGR